MLHLFRAEQQNVASFPGRQVGFYFYVCDPTEKSIYFVLFYRESYYCFEAVIMLM